MGEYNPIGAGTKEQLARQYDALESDRQAALEEIRAKKLKDRTEPILYRVEVEYLYSKDFYVEAKDFEDACEKVNIDDDSGSYCLSVEPVTEWDETLYVKKGDEYVEVNGNSS